MKGSVSSLFWRSTGQDGTLHQARHDVICSSASAHMQMQLAMLEARCIVPAHASVQHCFFLKKKVTGFVSQKGQMMQNSTAYRLEKLLAIY